MSHPVTYPHDKIGTLTHSTPEERVREGDRWVALRTLHTSSPTASAPLTPADDVHAPQTRALYRAVEARHAEARRKLNTNPK